MILDRLLEKRASFSQADPKDPVVATWFGGRDTISGVPMTPDSVLALTAVYACVRILSESIASLPLHLMVMEGGRKEHATGHPLYAKLKTAPNRWQTSYEWREMMVAHAALRGAAYSEIVSTPSMPVAQLIPLHPDRVRPFQTPTGEIAYEYTPAQGEKRIILWSEMHVLQGLALEDWATPLDPTHLLRDAFGNAKAVDTHAGKWFANGARPGFVLEHPGKLSEEAQKRLVAAWEARHRGAQNNSRTAVLEEGMKAHEVGVDPEKSQLLESRKYSVNEICRIFRVPPHMVGDLERATFSNIEHQGLEFVTHTLRPWLVRWEQAMHRDLLTRERKNTHFFKFKADALLRGDLKARYEAYRVGREWGWLSANDVRDLEDKNPIESGDQYLVPMNMTTPELLENPPQPETPPDELEEASAERVARKEFRAFTRAVKTPETVPEWVGGFIEKHTAWTREATGRDCSAVVEWLRENWQTLPADEDGFISERAAQYLELWHG